MNSFRASDGAELAFADSGSGTPALLFVHGWQADRSVWHDVAAALGPAFRTIAVDLRGSGASQAAGAPYSLERFAADLRELIEALGVAPIVIGHSMGATVGLRLAVDAPRAVRGLVLVAPVPASGGGYSAKGEAFLRATAGNPEAARNWLARTLVNPSEGAVLDVLCAAAARSPREAALASFESWAHAGFAEETKRIETPTLVIAPERDAPDVAEAKVAALIPDARQVVLPEAAHYAIVENAAAIAALIRDFALTSARDDAG